MMPEMAAIPPCALMEQQKTVHQLLTDNSHTSNQMTAEFLNIHEDNVHTTGEQNFGKRMH
jgi:hypothetical protein